MMERLEAESRPRHLEYLRKLMQFDHRAFWEERLRYLRSRRYGKLMADIYNAAYKGLKEKDWNMYERSSIALIPCVLYILRRTKQAEILTIQEAVALATLHVPKFQEIFLKHGGDDEDWRAILSPGPLMAGTWKLERLMTQCREDRKVTTGRARHTVLLSLDEFASPACHRSVRGLRGGTRTRRGCFAAVLLRRPFA